MAPFKRPIKQNISGLRPFVKGQSGNPKGRPPKERAWADLVAKYGKGKVELADGTEMLAQDLIAKLTIEGLVTGKINFPRLKGDRRKPRLMPLPAKEWIKFLKETREHLEGGPKMEVDLTSGGESLAPPVNVYIPDNGRSKK